MIWYKSYLYNLILYLYKHQDDYQVIFSNSAI